MKMAKIIQGYSGPNPFSDSQSRNFSDEKVSDEFCPTSTFWSLFNDQHEVLLGTRGSGKTYLLKMMRYSMLKRIDDPMAQKLVKEKKFIALYVPMHLEFVTYYLDSSAPIERQMSLFQIEFNCMLAHSLVLELKEIVQDIPETNDRMQAEGMLVNKLSNIWFGQNANLYGLSDVAERIDNLFYNTDPQATDLHEFPTSFKRQICSSLLVVKSAVASVLGWSDEPTWIICVDEAEFLEEPFQKCINSILRSDSNRIVLKVATLPFYHKTLDTLSKNITISEGNDFAYRVVDMAYDSQDFINLTNKLCSHRIKTRVNSDLDIPTLEDFLGCIGNDDLIDYYKASKADHKDDTTTEAIEKMIVKSFSAKREHGASSYSNKRKTIYDKYAPIFFAREMYKMSTRGNTNPGWYAGASTVRKIAQGNPRTFIYIMSLLFNEACKTPLTTKAQHRVLVRFSEDYCDATKSLDKFGPIISRGVSIIAECLHDRVHNQELKSTGTSFYLKFEDFSKHVAWIQNAIAHSRLIVDENTIKHGISLNTKYLLSNAYAAKYWIPMRGDIPTHVFIKDNILDGSYIVNTNAIQRKKRKATNGVMQQMSFLEAPDDDT